MSWPTLIGIPAKTHPLIRNLGAASTARKAASNLIRLSFQKKKKGPKHVALLRQNQRSQLVEDVLGAERVARDYVYFATRIKLLDFANEHGFQNKIAQACVSR